MLILPGYQVGEELHRSSNSIVHRGQREADQLPVILKALNKAYPTSVERARLEQEYELLRLVAGVGVIGTVELVPHQHGLVLVLEDFGATSLKQWMREEPRSLRERLEVMLGIVEALAKIHERAVIHKDLNPTNIVINPGTGQIKLIDFGLATTLAQEEATLQQVERMEGTLLYLAPEQSGRMNRVVDYRSDFYALGVTFYELLAGQLPFHSTDPLELVHAHIAREPAPPHALNPEIPEVLSAIILKLMAKAARLRYQSAYGLQSDLAEVLRQLRESGSVDPFPLGQQDLSPRFRLSQTLYGREVELDALLAAFERVSAGAPELLLVAGYAGVGKSALINELHKPLVGRRGYFISGKFDQFQRNIPYTALIQAFRDLIRQLLTESDERVAHWRETLQQALGPNGQVIVDVIPEVALLIGPQPALPELAVAEHQNRFQWVFQNFIDVFTRSEHPLVLFLDDLQWADSASIRLLQRFLTDAQQRYLLALGAYRDSEVDGVHPLTRMMQETEQAGVGVSRLSLAPLGQPDVTRFVAETLHRLDAEVEALAETIFAKTQGNPFFVGEFLRALHEEGFLTFRPEGWWWDLAQIQARAITDNVVELMQGKVQQLPERSQVALRLAASIGNTFDLATLAEVQEQSAGEVAHALWPALDAGLLVPLGEGYRLLQTSSASHAEPLAEDFQVAYRFLHDRVQQAAYQLIPLAERPALHLRMGRLLLANSTEAEREARLFEIADHLNLGVALISDPHERELLARLNLQAGQKARAATAYEPAFQYLSMGIRLLPATSWHSHYELTLASHLAAAESAALKGDFAQMEALAQSVLAHADSLLDRIKVYEVQVQAHIAQNRMWEALERALEALNLLGVKLPTRPTIPHLLLGFLQTRWLLWRYRFEQLEAMPLVQDAHKLAILRLLVQVFSASTTTAPNLYPLVIFTLVQLSVHHGLAPASAFGYVAYGVLLCLLGDIKRGHAYGQFGMRLSERLSPEEFQVKASVIYAVGAQIWDNQRGASLPIYQAAYQRGVEVGDLEYAAMAAMVYLQNLFQTGQPLVTVARESARYGAALQRLRQPFPLYVSQLTGQLALNLMGRAEDPCALIGEAADEREMLPRLVVANNRLSLSSYTVYKLVLCYHSQSYEQAVHWAEETLKYVDRIGGTALYYFYASLALLAHYPNAPGKAQKRYLKQVASQQKKIKKWATRAPMKYQNEYELVEAERARLRGDHARAMEHYQQAIALAHQHEDIQDEALANELAGQYYLERGMAHVARSYLLDARQDYLAWGAMLKVQQLEARYPELLEVLREQDTSTQVSSTFTTSSHGSTGQQLDLATVVKASQAISSEIDLDQLLSKLLHTVMENAGAQKGTLLLAREGRLRVEVEGSIHPPQMRLLQSLPVEESKTLSPAIVHYVERTQEDIVLDDASQEGRFTTDPYIQRQRPRSILAAPLLNQSQLIGVLYLENNLTMGAFTPARVEMVRLLGTQAAISITNAQAIAARAEQERLQLEKQLLEQRAQDLAELNASKDKFFSIISHDLRSPFNGLLGLSQLMHKFARDLSQEEVEQYAGRVYASGQQVLALLDTLLEWSQMQTGRMPFEPSPVDFHEVARRNLALLADNAESKQIRLVSELGEGMVLYADLHMLDTVTRNLLSNALKFTPGGGQVTLAALPQGGMIEISVSDTGVGMDEETMQKLFRIDVTHTTQGTAQEKGSGLGLILCKELVEKNGGRIWVESTPGQGSAFRFTVPAAPAVLGNRPL